MKTNIHVLVEQILEAPIPDEIKIQAFDDIYKMVTDERYGGQVELWIFEDCYYAMPPLPISFIFRRTDLGWNFYKKLNTILYS